MALILRIKPPAVNYDAAAATEDPTKNYVDRLIKLIPAEIVSIYLAGKSGIEAAFPPGGAANTNQRFISENIYWIGWTIFCFLAVFIVRAWATSDSKQSVKPEWPAVFIAAGSFVVWVYSLGDVFARPTIFGHDRGIWEPLLAMLIVFAWTLIVPIVYRQKDV
jgi:membrane protease YdiL (CAAX protease family)